MLLLSLPSLGKSRPLYSQFEKLDKHFVNGDVVPFFEEAKRLLATHRDPVIRGHIRKYMVSMQQRVAQSQRAKEPRALATDKSTPSHE